MAVIMTNLLYLTISLALVGLVGRALSRSGRAVLRAAPGGRDGVAEAASRLLTVAFYLLSLGFIALTMRVWSHVGSPGQALQLVSVKIGELLLVLGALHVASTVVFARLRRVRSWAAPPGPGTFSPADPGSGGPGSDDPGAGGAGADGAGAGGAGAGRLAAHRAAGPADYPPGPGAGAHVASPTLWRSRLGRAVH